MPALLELPHELLLQILNLLEVKELARCASVCQNLNNIIRNSLALQYKLSLSKSCLQDGTRGDLPSRYDALKAYQSSWKHLSWAKPCYFPLTDGTWELSSGVLSQNTEISDFTFKFQNLLLPSKSRGIPAESWSFTVDIPVIDYTMDVSQDLVVIIAMHIDHPVHVDQNLYDLHCLTLSTGQPHPERQSGSPLECDIIQAGFGGQYRLQIQENLFGLLLIGPAGTEFSIRDWKTGEIKLVVVGWSLTAFAFITDDLVLLGTGTGYNTDYIPRLDIISIRQNQSDNIIYRLPEIERICILQLPELHQITHRSDMRFTIRTDPFPSTTSTTKTTTTTPAHSSESNGKEGKDHHKYKTKRPEAPFHTWSKDRLFVISYGDWTWTLFNIVIPYSRLVHLAQTVPSNHTSDPLDIAQHHELHWDEWGPHNSRLLDGEFKPSTTWVCYVHGMKMVVKVPEGHMALLDFGSPVDEAGHWIPDHDEGGPILEVKPLKGRTRFQELDMERRTFDKDVYSSLPCTVTYFDIPGRTDPITAVMLSEDNLIILFRPLTFEKYVIYSL